MADKPVDTAIVMVVGPCIDDTDFKTLEESIAYNAAGMDISMIVEKTDGTTAVTAITLTTGGTSDWTHKDGGYYEIEITAAQNSEEGIAFLRGICTGVLPFESPRYSIVVDNVYDSLCKGTDKLQTDVTQWLGTAAATPTVAGIPEVDITHIAGAAVATGTAQLGVNVVTEDNIDFGALKKSSLDAATPASIVGAVGSVTGNVGGNVAGSVGSVVGHTPQTGDNYARIGAAGVALTDLGGMSTAMKAEVQTEANDALVAQKLDHLVAVADTDDVVDNSIIAKMVSKAATPDWSTFVNTDDSLEAIRDRGDIAWTTGAGGSSPTVQEIRTEMDDNSTKLSDIVADTNELQTNQGGWVTATGFNIVVPDVAGTAAGLHTITDGLINGQNDISSAQVNAECDTALADYDGPTRIEATSDKDAILADHILMKQATAGTYNRDTDSLQAIRDQGDAAWTTGAGGSSPTVQEIRTEMDDNSTKLIDIVADTNELQTNQGNWSTATGFNTVIPDVAGTAAGLHATTDGKVDAVQTDTTAIKAKTDNLPSGIAKNVALAGFNVFMVLSSDDKTAATGKTVSCTISKDGGAFASATNSVVEISAGMYKIDLTQAEMNADVVTLRFTATDCNDRVITVYTS
ncbi:MAG: hypothetical protein ACT6FG_00090 [Methanosarcinaceae archaeon]